MRRCLAILALVWAAPQAALSQDGGSNAYGVGRAWGNAAILAGTETTAQFLWERWAWTLPDDGGDPARYETSGLHTGFGSYGTLPLRGKVGVYWDLSLPVRFEGLASAEAFGGLAVGGEHVSAWLGLGGLTVPWTDREGLRTFVQLQPDLGIAAGYRLAEWLTFESGASVGWLPGVTHAKARISLGVETRGSLGYCVGLYLGSVQGDVVQRATGANAGGFRRTHVEFRLGMSFGR